MANVLTGKLLLVNGQKRVSFPTKKGPMSPPSPFDREELAPALTSAAIPEDGLPVDLELMMGKPTRIRPVGQPWQAVSTGSPGRPTSGASGMAVQNTGPTGRQPAAANVPREFHNPYNFVPAPPREGIGMDLGDGPPAGHDILHPDRWSGRIRVRLTTVTPLLAVDASLVRMEGDHGLYPVRLGPDGQPYLAPTAVKGMLRSAYEAVTNSRMGVFETHEDRLAYRAVARTTTRPARVEKVGQDLVFRPLTPVRLPRYDKYSKAPDHGEKQNALKYAGSGAIPRHGDHVYVRTQKHGVDVIVEEIRPFSDSPPAGGFQAGWVCVTGANIRGKKCERVFIQDGGKPVAVTAEHRKLWKELIANYQDIHEKDLEERAKKNKKPDEYLGDKPGETAWSRHVYESGLLDLKEGTLCYVEEREGRIVGVCPVSISRRLFRKAPTELLPKCLKPAPDRDHLSPADRVFGWVNTRPGSEGAYRGCLRIGQVKLCPPAAGEPAVTEFPSPGVPLAILGQPRPQQSRFYAAASIRGEAQADGLSKENAGYSDQKGLRGRKVYPHHGSLPTGYWTYPPEGTMVREFIRPGGDRARDNQNRSILGWIRPEVTFTSDIHVTNLSHVELGALLWLLDLPPDHYHRLGGGKPLGFGSIHLEVEWQQTDLRTGDQWKAFYSSLDREPVPDSAAAKATVDEFQQAVSAAYAGGAGFKQAPFIAAFLKSASGFGDGLPIHYPRLSSTPQVEGENFKWFVANESDRQGLNRKLALRDLATDPGLPRYQGEEDNRGGQSGRPHGGRGRNDGGGQRR